jgi:hypothetical protein
MAAIVKKDTPCKDCGAPYITHLGYSAPTGCVCFIPPDDVPRNNDEVE